MLEVAVIVLAVFSVLLAAACGWLILSQRHLAALQAERDAVRDQRLKELSKRLDTYLTGSVRMGEELYELRRVVAPLPDKLTQIEQRDPSSLSFTQAARLAGMAGLRAPIDAVARYEAANPAIQVTLIEPVREFMTCPFTNLYLGGLRTLEQQSHNYDELRALGVTVVHDYADAVDAQKQTVKVAGGQTFAPRIGLWHRG